MDIPDIPASWQQAFETHKIPVVRAIEKQLVSGISRDRERLRGLVGGNYRDLLSTADEIVKLDARTRSTEEQISSLSQRCKPSQGESEAKGVAHVTSLAAQLYLLNKSILCGTTALRDGSVLLCARLTVLSRLLLKSLSQAESSVQSIEQQRGRAASLRRRLLQRVDSYLVHPASTIANLIETLCAYCLVTGASSSDALKHFQERRLDRLKRRISISSQNDQQLNQCFLYLIRSIHTLKVLPGRRLNDQLSSLQKHSIIEHLAITDLESLGIRQMNTLIPSDILTFTSYVKRVQFSKDEIEKIVEDWATEACEIFFNGLSTALDRIKHVGTLLSLRKALFDILLPVYFSTNSHQALLEGVRQAIAGRVTAICKDQIEAVLHLGADLVSLETLPPLLPPVWEESFIQHSSASGKAISLQLLRARHLGTRGGLGRNLKALRSWAKGVVQLRDQLHALGLIRWQDVIEDDEDDEQRASVIVTQLAVTDVEEFESAVQQSLKTTMEKFESLLQGAITSTVANEEGDVNTVVFLLRALRESSSVIQCIRLETTSLQHLRYERLHQTLAKEVVKRMVAKFEKASEGDNIPTPLPDGLPSPLTFSVIREVCVIMNDIGSIDLWSRVAVGLLKERLRERILSNDTKSFYAHTDFDVEYLRAALDDAVSTADPPSTDRKESAAVAYWNRTKALFGILNT